MFGADVSGNMMMMTTSTSQSKLLQQLNKFYNERVQSRRASVAKNLREVCTIVQDVLKEVETQEPRFVSSLSEINGHYEGLQVCLSIAHYAEDARGRKSAKPIFGVKYLNRFSTSFLAFRSQTFRRRQMSLSKLMLSMLLLRHFY